MLMIFAVHFLTTLDVKGAEKIFLSVLTACSFAQGVKRCPSLTSHSRQKVSSGGIRVVAHCNMEEVTEVCQSYRYTYKIQIRN